MTVRRRDFLGLPLHPVTTRQTIDGILRAAQRPRSNPHIAAYLNAHTANLAWEDRWLRAWLRAADLVYADGMGVVWAARAAGIAVPERVSAADFFLRFAREAADRGVPLALVGGAPGVAHRCAKRLRRAAPSLRIAYISDGFLRDRDWPAIAEALRRSGAGVALLGMGTPRQEKLAEFLRRENAAPSLWCVGALFEYFSGTRARAPLWMRRAGLEWAFRLALEPRRMAVRYLLGNPRFALRTIAGVAWSRLK